MVVALLVAFPLLVIAEGIVAPVELLSTLGNILSYARIMALGTASVMLAVVANRLAGAIGSVVVGVIFALLFHLVNFALGLFSPTIHALRLHYVEFFGRFYSPGGVQYRPFRHWRMHLMQIFWITLSAALAIAIPALATAWAQSRIGPAAAASLAEKPELSTTVIVMLAIPETMSILGFVVAMFIMFRAGG